MRGRAHFSCSLRLRLKTFKEHTTTPTRSSDVAILHVQKGVAIHIDEMTDLFTNETRVRRNTFAISEGRLILITFISYSYRASVTSGLVIIYQLVLPEQYDILKSKTFC